MLIKYNQINYNISNPNVCPHCHVVNTPHNLWYVFSNDSDNKLAFISSWNCANSDCAKVFVTLHKLNGNQFIFKRFLNGLPKGPDWPKPILNLRNGNTINSGQPESSKFIKTYLQSLVAENDGLDELAGMGYRKAIEYLVKDWAIQNDPNDIEIINSSWLGSIITRYYVGDIKEILERATWLGNDQAHYKRIFEDFDINDLKELIDLIMVELDRQFKKKHYIDNIQKKNNGA
jgi:hypothetical protein